jgi:outer membrane lipoprotein carrier protein
MNLTKPRAIRSNVGLLAIAFVLSVSAFADNDVSRIADQVDAHYNHLRTLRADFTETYTGAGVSRVESGTLWLKRPGRMRWEYRQPREKLFLSDGSTAWFYVPGEKQARKAPVKKLEDLRSPLAYLLGRTKLQKEFTGLSFAPDVKPETPDAVVLRGVPRRIGEINQVLMEVAPDGRFIRILVAQDDGSTTDFHFYNEKDEAAIPDRNFQFSPPPGVETIEMDQLSQ